MHEILGIPYPLMVVIGVTAVMGFITYLAFPLVRWTRFLESPYFVLFNAIGLGILIFLIADVFVDVAQVIWPNDAIYADTTLSAIFLVCCIVAFVIPWVTEGEEGEGAEDYADRIGIAVATGIGFQNLTEGLVFGAAWALGQIPLALVVFVGYSVQNVTEGFPIVSAYFGSKQPSTGRMTGLFFLRGIPEVFGGVMGWAFVAWASSYQSLEFDTAFNALAIGACLYCVLPIFLQSFKPAATPEATALRRKLVYWGVILGWVIGFVCEMI